MEESDWQKLKADLMRLIVAVERGRTMLVTEVSELEEEMKRQKYEVQQRQFEKHCEAAYNRLNRGGSTAIKTAGEGKQDMEVEREDGNEGAFLREEY